MPETITLEEHRRLLAEASVAIRQGFADDIRQLREALAQAKQVIAALQTKLYGVQAEASRIVLAAEGQQVIDPAWQGSQDQAPAPAAPVVETVVRTPRDRRGLAQRHPHLPMQEADAALPPELAEQVTAGVLQVRRSGKHHDELVLPQGRPFLRRIHEVEVVRARTGQVMLQVMPERIVPGGDLADESIHRLVEGKFLDAVPFHRQLAQLERQRVELPKQTVNDAVNAWGDTFAPLAQAITEQILQEPVVHADASWQRLQGAGSCSRIHIWTVLGGGQIAYRLSEDLTHARAAEIIPPTFANRLVTDAWPGWFKLGLGERLFLCNAHARRPFADWLKRHPGDPDARSIVERYRQLASIEHETDEAPPDDRRERRRQLRDTRSRPIMAELRAEAERIAARYPPSHQLADGSRYIIDYWDGLARHLDHPDVPPDNNAAENALRINALIRKNSLFVGSLDAAKRDITALTILHSCKAQGINPSDYLAAITPAMLLHRRGRNQDLARITPRAWAAGRH